MYQRSVEFVGLVPCKTSLIRHCGLVFQSDFRAVESEIFVLDVPFVNCDRHDSVLCEEERNESIQTS